MKECVNMFSGLVSEIGIINNIQKCQKTIRLTVAPKKTSFLNQTLIGDSIAINGACLTVENLNDKCFQVSIMPQTFNKTNFKNYQKGELVNLEHSIRINSRLNGHIVTGHIDEVCSVLKTKINENALEVYFNVSNSLRGQIINQGSVTINGVSLTVMNAGDNWFSVGIIPHTRKCTNLGVLVAGDKVNLETDIIGKYVMQYLKKEV